MLSRVKFVSGAIDKISTFIYCHSMVCALLCSDLFNMATGHSFSVLASHSVKQPINPKTGLAFTTYERKSNTETTNGNERNDERRAPVRASLGSGALNWIGLMSTSS